MEVLLERQSQALGGLFQAVIGDMKTSYPVWEDFITKATKLNSQLRTTVLATTSFLDAFQRVADMATSTRGATRELGSSLTRMCLRHKRIESKFRQFSTSLMESLITPLQDKIEDWKKTATQLDKDHAKDFKRARQEIKKKSSDTLKLQKKVRKGKGEMRPALDSALQDVSDSYLVLEELEKQAVRRALTEERARFCCFVSFLHPVLEEELSMLEEVTHLQSIMQDLAGLSSEPHCLPPASEQVILDLKGSDLGWRYQTPPGSPSHASSRKMSVCSLAQPPLPTSRLSSISSHDSGFPAHEVSCSKSPSPMPPESQKSLSSASSEASEQGPSASDCSSPSSVGSGSTSALVWGKLDMVEGLSPRELTALTQGLQLDGQGSSRDSLQGSSGCSTQTSTPTCSEDTISSQASDSDYISVNGEAEGEPAPDLDRWSTVPRGSELVQAYRRLLQGKRPVSAVGWPLGPPAGMVTGHTPPPSCPSGVATIRRIPSTKTGRRPLSAAVPIPVRPPAVPRSGPYFDASRSADEIGRSIVEEGTVTTACPAPCLVSPEEQLQIAANRRSMVEKLGSVMVSARAHAVATSHSPTGEMIIRDPQEARRLTAAPNAGLLHPAQAQDMLTAIRRGVRLRKTFTNDRSAPRI
uniref:MTSS I-BAR domain containing 2 n=1 Tax=Eptatretus burgeri TaxID=7764 RepID=A0A8C4QY50_EPTBU